MQTEGVSSLYRGFLPALIGTIPGVALYFGTYEFSKSWFTSRYGQSSHLINFGCGFLAEAVSCVVWVPSDVLKERGQVGVVNAGIARIIEKEGIRGLYRGYAATLASFGPFSAFYFMFVEQLKTFSKHYYEVLSFPQLVGICAISGGCAAFITAPMDLVKVRMQVDQNRGTRSLVSALKHVLVNDGWLGLFRGGGSRVWFAVPNTAITMAAMDYIKHRFGPIHV